MKTVTVAWLLVAAAAVCGCCWHGTARRMTGYVSISLKHLLVQLQMRAGHERLRCSNAEQPR